MAHRRFGEELAGPFPARFEVDGETILATKRRASKRSANNSMALAVRADALAQAC
jgi:hypothetical protein